MNTTPTSSNDADASGQCVSTSSLPGCVAPGSAVLGKASLQTLMARAEAFGERNVPLDNPCHQHLAISFFFDGTGNNKDEDAPKNKTSNIARLYEAHIHKPLLNVARVYIPGVGTPFPEVGDKGGTLGDAVGKGGEKRIKFAMKEFDRYLKIAEARATNPANKIASIHIAIFGFSRGAAQARAFAIRLHQRLETTASGWVLKGKGYPVRVYFMGLFDTVAAVGLSNTLRNPEKRRAYRAAMRGLPVVGPVFGGAIADAVVVNSEALKGHNDWGSELRVPPSVLQCLHYTAAHEVRESFPLDTVRVAGVSSYPPGCTETVFPGMHSDVGGGYMPGEQGRSANPDAQLSQVPLLHMFRAARDAGVPLFPETKMKPEVSETFKLCKEFSALYDHYRAMVQASGSVEQQNAAHLYWYYRWRTLRATAEGDPYLERLDRERDAALEAAREYERKRQELMAEAFAAQAAAGGGLSPTAQLASGARPVAVLPSPRDEVDAVLRKSSIREQAEMARKKRQEAEAAGGIAKQIREEDGRFIEDCRNLAEHERAGQALTLHEKTVLRAWKAPRLDDPQIIEFFDFHVHDSVAGFRAGGAGAVDNSRVARPRDVFVGRGSWQAG